MNLEQFDIQFQYSEYLKRMELNEATMNPIQVIETKRAFMGGFAVALVVFRDEITKLDDDAAVVQMESMTSQLSAFWVAQKK
jgi:hypothetical protein